MDDLNKQIKLINNEDIVWYIYFFIIISALFTNYLEKKYLYDKNKYNKELAQKINTIILVVAFFIYLYFLKLAYDNAKDAYKSNDIKNRRICMERLIVSTLFLVAGAIAIYTDYDNNTSNIDIGII